MEAVWQRTGDLLGDFVRLVLLLEELLERLGAPKGETLGGKLRSGAVEAFLQSYPDRGALRGRLWRLVELRNAVLHERAEVPPWAFLEGKALVGRLLAALERQGLYSREEWAARVAFLESPAPPAPQAFPETIPPEAARAPEVRERPPMAWWMLRWPGLPLPQRFLGGRALALPRRKIR
ncbi:MULTISPECIES: hypothetical protein [unclassified Meiothermus]|uniref:hypothetical protein n=1 Tax=unclassified Meiothermus TaxID=370471 RepID=UPI000D7CA80D|nr:MULTISPECIES: hypothetical protein [unclassified Meiothermus]PZA06181.1 hypothetical protein DNA98_14545 [Meiothermus sp. Pnk-1]RYM37483.1 hypothetical protein EWH23_06175 [Meiothermus sp. PNK-Is4]